MSTSATTAKIISSGNGEEGESYRDAYALHQLVFLWGTAYGLLDVLNKQFQEALHVTKTRSTLL